MDLSERVATLSDDDIYWLNNPHWSLELSLVIFKKWATLFIVPIGVFGNLASLLITTKKTNRRISTCVYMSGLSVFDALHLVVMGTIAILNHGVANHMANLRVMISIVNYLAYATVEASRFCLAAMSVDRAYPVLYPMKAKTTCTASRACKGIALSAILPLLWSVTILIPSFPGTALEKKAVHSFDIAFAVLTPFAAIAVANILIIYGLKRAASKRKTVSDNVPKSSLKGMSSKEKSLAWMLVLVSIVFLVLSTPYFIHELLRFAVPSFRAGYDMRYRYWKMRWEMEHWLMITISTTNSAVNFYLYVLGGGQNYRNDVKELFRLKV